MSFPADLPTDIATLQALLRAAEERVSERDARLAERDAVIERKEERIVRLEKLVADFKRAMFGAKSEKADPDQYQLALEDIETAIATVHAEDKAIDPPKAQPRKRNANRGALPKHLPRVEEMIMPESITCDCGCDRRRYQRAVGYYPGPVPCDCHPPSEVCLPVL